jgi:hypothetical protein
MLQAVKVSYNVIKVDRAKKNPPGEGTLMYRYYQVPTVPLVLLRPVLLGKKSDSLLHFS